MRSHLCSALLWTALSLVCASWVFSEDPGVLRNPSVSQPVGFAVTPPLRDLVRDHPQEIPFGFHQEIPVRYPKERLMRNAKHREEGVFRDPLAQPANPSAMVPTKLLDWLGMGQGFFGYPVYIVPSDMNLSIGDTEIVQWGNNNFAVFDLNGNNLLFDQQPFVPGNILFSALPVCGQRNDGDPIVQWDKIAHRWVMIQSVMTPPARDCIAVSQTADALGAWYAYEYPLLHADTDTFDYTKLGVWPDAYYTSHNDFLQNGPYQGPQPCAYERAKLLAGDSSAQQVCFLDRAGASASTRKKEWVAYFDDNLLPADLDSPNSLPPAGTPELYMGSITNTVTGYVNNVYYYKFHVDWNNPANSSFSCVNGGCAIPVQQFYLGSWLGLAPQPGGNSLQTMADRLMYRLAYRVLPSSAVPKTVRGGSQQIWLVSHAVGNNGSLAVRWYEFRAPLNSTDPYVYQQGTYAPRCELAVYELDGHGQGGKHRVVIHRDR